ncbi:single-stranded DNA-binding protein [candidate division KSB1 bacterium]|nr:single-stranded DNA-binding protein [candidate division KSB1 bacterium]
MARGRGTLNKVMLIGRLGGDPELKYTPSGTAVVNFSLATNMVWKDQSGNQQEKTEWHRIVAWRKTAEFVGEWVKKGARVYVEGRLETRSWDDQSGNKRYMTEVVADDIEILGDRREGGAQTSGSPEPPMPVEPPDQDEPPQDDLPF